MLFAIIDVHRLDVFGIFYCIYNCAGYIPETWMDILLLDPEVDEEETPIMKHLRMAWVEATIVPARGWMLCHCVRGQRHSSRSHQRAEGKQG